MILSKSMYVLFANYTQSDGLFRFEDFTSFQLISIFRGHYLSISPQITLDYVPKHFTLYIFIYINIYKYI